MIRKFIAFFRHLVFGIILPTADVYSDINFAISAFSTDNPRIGMLMLLPVILNLAFNIYLWKITDFDSKVERRFTWLLLIFNVWPQSQVLKLIISIFKTNKNWKERQEKIKMELSYIEPFIEAVPQYFIALGVFTMLLGRTWHGGAILNNLFEGIWSIWRKKEDNEIVKVFGKDTLGISNTIMFPLSLAISFVTGVRCVTDYLQNGQIKISSENKLCNLFLLITKLIYVGTQFLNTFFICIVYSSIPLDGAWICFIIFTIYIIIPSLWMILPIARYLGIKKFALFFLQNPQLLILPIITDFVFGPMNGYRKSNCCCCKCCCSIGCCFCWCFCCQKFRFEEGIEITISKEMSWVKMIYSLTVLILFCIVLYISNDLAMGFVHHQLLIAYFVLAGVGKIAFITILHTGKVFHVLTFESS